MWGLSYLNCKTKSQTEVDLLMPLWQQNTLHRPIGIQQKEGKMSPVQIKYVYKSLLKDGIICCGLKKKLEIAVVLIQNKIQMASSLSKILADHVPYLNLAIRFKSSMWPKSQFKSLELGNNTWVLHFAASTFSRGRRQGGCMFQSPACQTPTAWQNQQSQSCSILHQFADAFPSFNLPKWATESFVHG